MSESTTATTDTSITTDPRVVIGVDVALRHEGDADPVAQRLGLALGAAGLVATVSTHVVPGLAGGPSYAALSVCLGAALGDRAATVVLDELGAAARADEAGVVGERFVHGPRPLVDGARAARDQRLSGTGGRAVWFPGVERLVGTLSAAHVVEVSHIDVVTVLGGGPAPDDAIVDTRDFVRPRWQTGRLVLHVQPAAGRRLVPFEVANPTPCCATH